MLEKISICLVHPKLMGRYVLDKTWKTVLMVVGMLIINIVSIMLIAVFDNDISKQDENMIMSAIVNDKNRDLKYDGKLSGSASTTKLEGVNYYFFTSPSVEAEAPVNVYLAEDSYSIYLLGFKLEEKSYESIGLKSFDISDGLTKEERAEISKLVNSTVTAFVPSLAIVNGIVSSFDMLVTFLMMFLLILFLGAAINPNVNGIYRVRLVFLSLFSYAFIYWLYLATGVNFLYFFATAISYIYYFVAARNIIKIGR